MASVGSADNWRYFVSIPFSRSIRSLDSDSFRSTLVGLVVAIILVTAWIAWFSLGRVTLYETGQVVSVARGGEVVVDFSSEARGRIQRGQAALVQFDGDFGTQIGAIPAIVTNVPSAGQDDRVEVKLYLLASVAISGRSQDNLTGQAKVEVEHISPAVLVMRAAGQFVDTPSVSLSPQNVSE